MQQQQVKNSTNTLDICKNHQEQRLDNFLFYKVNNVSRSQIYKFIRTGQVRVNGGRIKSSYKLQLGDKVRLPPFVDLSTSEAPTVNLSLKTKLTQRILFEDDDLLVIDKPAGLAVHGGSGISAGLIESLRAMRPTEKLELVHRLDRETSGCIMVAKSRSMLVHCHQMLRDGLITKTYLTLVVGDWRGPKQVCMPLKKNHLQSGERVVKVDPDGKEALTHFKKIQSLPNATLLEASPITGRTHQIRVHAAFMNHPIIGDPKYGKTDVNKAFAQLGIKRLFLHAHTLLIPKKDGTKLKVSAKLDPELDAFLKGAQSI